ncbi:EF-P beta-lysylation protein EpmB [Methylomarinum sp. Ch1-1]|uniref:L-lysine 2,3-aminomutase n=1 Tax=Methylomarinum roseum TaxID=3067653 RepID=A0AAU7NPU4_9GAMM|nr:EF-P beta-lysylation protein EpmB [Methylomarinum sp. Ch1-1]MDP4521113.1 EF-P beta-lysylation protein EpmB [Methylomarinum sp. Ch1-1]
MELNNTSWQQQLAEAFTDLNDLCRHLNIAIEDLPVLADHKAFPLKAPRSFVDCIEAGNPADPLLRQVLPLQQELSDLPGFSADPVGDLDALAEAGVLHKYQGRALFIMTGACAINCRYCFRRNFPYSDVQLTPQRQARAIAYLKTHPDISEIILSGGDPMLLSDDKLIALIRQLEQIPHLERIRIHSRLPIVLPARVTPALLDCLRLCAKPVVIVLHANHGNELSDAVKGACGQLKNQGVTLLNQSVLLKGVNDTVSALCELNEKLFSIGVLPYYLHMLDKASGTGHFAVSQEQALLLMNQIKKHLPGYLTPKLVKEVAGAPNKIMIS